MPKIFNVLGKVSELCRVRGFIFEKSIPFLHGNIGNTTCNLFDYGPLGVELKRNITNQWWNEIVTSQNNIYGLDLSMLNKFQYGVNDDTKESHESSLLNSFIPLGGYLNGTCYHALNYMENYGFKMPFGLAQNIKILLQDKEADDIDKLIFRSQQKEYLKLCFFCLPHKLNFWMDYWMRKRLSWWKKFADIPVGFSLTESAGRGLFPMKNNSLLKDTVSIEFEFPWGKEAVESISSYFSIHDLIKTDIKTAVDDHPKTNITNREEMGIVVATLSIERGILAYLLDAFQEKDLVNSEGHTSQYNILRLHPVLAPVKVAVLANDLSNNDLCNIAQQLATELRQAGIPSSYVECEDRIKCYLNQDEIGTPYCVTIQDSTLTNGIVTLRNRDTTLSEFLHVSEILKTVQCHLDSF